MRVPSPSVCTTVVVASAEKGDPVTTGGRTTWSWEAPDQQASYLTTASVGDYELRRSETRDGLPIIDAVDDALTPANRTRTDASLALQADMIEFLEDTFVRYPFRSYGSIVDDDSLGYALETQTRPIYSRVASEGTVADIGRQLLRYLALSGFFISAALTFTGGLQGTGDTKSPLLITLVSQVAIPIGLCTVLQSMRQLQPGWNVVWARWVAAARNSSSVCTFGPGKSSRS